MKERSDCFKIDQFSDYMHDIAWPTLDLFDSMRKPITPRWISATNSVTMCYPGTGLTICMAQLDNSNIKKHQQQGWNMADLWGQRTIEVFPTPAWHLSHLDVWIFPGAETCLRCGINMINKHIAKKVRFAPLQRISKNQIVRCFMIWILFLIWVINCSSVQYAQRLQSNGFVWLHVVPGTSIHRLIMVLPIQICHLTHIHTWIDISITWKTPDGHPWP